MFRKGKRPSFLQTPMPLSSMSRTMSITQEPNTLTPVIILYVTLSIPETWIYVIFPLHLRQPIFSQNPLVQSNTKKPSSFYSYTTPATPSDRFISTSISSRVPRTAYRFPTSCPRIRYFCDYVTSAKHYAIPTLWISCSSAWKQAVFSSVVDFLSQSSKKNIYPCWKESFIGRSPSVYNGINAVIIKI